MKNKKKQRSLSVQTGQDCCSSSVRNLERRDFLKMAALGASGFALSGMPVFAGPFSYDEMGHLIPADKKLSESWVRSLFERGKPEVFSSRNNELKYIGMPVGGLACGQLYLGGDGRLWLWHIFKTVYSREKDHGQRFDAMTRGGHYADPDKVFSRETRPVDQGTVISITAGGQKESRTLDSNGFKDIEFRGEYPISKVMYSAKDFPLEIQLEAFSPFIPLDTRDSALPLTVMSYTVKNTGRDNVKVELAKWMENAVCPYIDNAAFGNRINRLEIAKNRLTLLYSARDGESSVDTGEKLSEQHGYGSMALSLLNSEDNDKYALKIPPGIDPAGLIDQLQPSGPPEDDQTLPFGQKLMGAVGREFILAPGETKTVDFCISWYFPYLNQQEKETGQLLRLKDIKFLKLHYANRFQSAGEVAAYLQKNFDHLAGLTRQWNKVWYDSTLPYWLLDRTFIPINCLSTNTVVWFDNGRFWGWEGVECCPGTCQHVWHYTQSMARVFPKIERYLREEIDYGLSFREDGGMGHRDETAHPTPRVAHDGHCGTIIRAYREHKMSADNRFLKANYQKIKKSVQFAINEDGNLNGLLEGSQTNTLDATWYGPMGWISSLYLGALAAGKAMALEVGDHDFARECDEILKRGQNNIVKELYNGEYFIHKPDPSHPNAINTNDGCHIDQVLGQSVAFQAGIGERIIPEDECRSALKSIWKYNYAPDAYMYQKQHEFIKGARIYATLGEAGTIMCTWPKGGAERAVPGMDQRDAESETWLGPGGYFDECMNGFEYQVASHMINEGLLKEGLAITKSVHDRYNAKKRNPYNEIECGDHYSRSMASYGVYNAVCGYDHHGPKRMLSFNPKINPENFKAAFIVAEGWGSFSQKRGNGSQINLLEIKYGNLRINTFETFLEEGAKAQKVVVNYRGQIIPASLNQTGSKVSIQFRDLNIVVNHELSIIIQQS